MPHAWFFHFYVVSVASSIFWGVKIASKASSVMGICKDVQPGGTMSMNQIALLWCLMAVQGVRRLAESINSSKNSSSKMWVGHWIVGIWFYLAMGFAVWIDGAETLILAKSPIDTIIWSAPSIRTMLGIPLFILASGIQHDCHNYLSSLPKYTLPDHPIFHTMVCPHYTAECIIYLAMAILGAPEGSWINPTISCAVLFVAINLGVTASTTKQWYIKKFGKEKVEYRWKMLPLIF